MSFPGELDVNDFDPNEPISDFCNCWCHSTEGDYDHLKCCECEEKGI